jgi:hypothetical protein
VQSKEELIITAMQERIGQLSANYELQIAMLRAELTFLTNEKNDRQKSIIKSFRNGLKKLNIIKKIFQHSITLSFFTTQSLEKHVHVQK